jgi:hypothetical protein
MTAQYPKYGFDRKGNPIDDAYIAEAVEEAEAGYDPATFRPIGRPSLTGEARHSPKVSFRVTDDLRERAEAEARARGCTVSQLAREALEQYLAS